MHHNHFSSGAFFKDTILRNYPLEKSTDSISKVLNAQIFIKTYYLKVLKSAQEILVSIFPVLILQRIKCDHYSPFFYSGHYNY
jgi:hypothetical protein